MIAQLPKPYPDELLYSVIARYFTYFPPHGTRSAVTSIFGGTTDASVEFPRHIGGLANNTFPTWGLSADEIIDQLTLFPYFSAFADSAASIECRNAMKSGQDVKIHARLGIATRVSRVEMPQFLRFCARCVSDDMVRYGETYWRRAHQLPGVLVCTQHEIELSTSGALMRPLGPIFSDAMKFTLPDPPAVNLSKRQMKLAIEIADRSAALLHGRDPSASDQKLNLAYRETAIRRGFRIGQRLVNSTEFSKAFADHYGPSLLQRLGCPIGNPGGVYGHWVRTLLRDHKCRFHPLQHVLMQFFLETLPEKEGYLSFFGRGPWRCPSPIGKHDEEYPIKAIRFVPARGKYGALASTRCSCGYRFSFRTVADDDPSMPVVSHVSKYGHQYFAEAKRLAGLGYSIVEIANRFDVHYEVAKKLVQRADGVADMAQKIERWRSDWIATRSHASYQKLKRHDKLWLRSQSRKVVDYTKQRKRQRTLTNARWAERDLKWVPQVRSAADAIRHAHPPRRVTKTAIALVAGLRSLNSKIHRLPLCAAVLKREIEGLADWNRRKSIAQLNEHSRASQISTTSLYGTNSEHLYRTRKFNDFTSPRQ